MKCKYCGNSLPDGSDFCIYCGQKQPPKNQGADVSRFKILLPALICSVCCICMAALVVAIVVKRGANGGESEADVYQNSAVSSAAAVDADAQTEPTEQTEQSAENSSDEKIDTPYAPAVMAESGCLFTPSDGTLVQMRKGPSEQYTLICDVSPGAMLTVYAEEETDNVRWIYTQYGSEYGWCRAELLKDTVQKVANVTEPQIALHSSERYEVVSCVNELMLRNEPNENSTSKIYINKGEKLTIYGEKRNDDRWLYTYKDGQFGWIKTYRGDPGKSGYKIYLDYYY